MTTSADNLQLTHIPAARTEMLIRKPVTEVFEAFIDPSIASRFWFTKGSGKLEAGAHVQWEWEMYGVSVDVSVKDIVQDKRILIEWPPEAAPTTVEWLFTALTDDTTFVSVTNAGFSGDGDAVVKQALDSTEGFALMLAGLKAFLEHNIELNLVADRFPAGLGEHQG